MSRSDKSRSYRPEKLVLFNNAEEPRHRIVMYAMLSHILIHEQVTTAL